jgi:hypothetical protein
MAAAVAPITATIAAVLLLHLLALRPLQGAIRLVELWQHFSPPEKPRAPAGESAEGLLDALADGDSESRGSRRGVVV